MNGFDHKTAPRRADRKIGGFFELDLGPRPGDIRDGGRFASIADRWFDGMAVVRDFHNARSALLGVCTAATGIRTLWLPAYICMDVITAARSIASTIEEIRFYPLSKAGEVAADAAFLDRHPRAGDAVVIVNYFGRPQSVALRRLVARRRDVLWIEDRAQALWSGRPFADAIIYSARKVVGVPDGGFLVVPSPGPLAEGLRALGEGKTRPADRVLPSLWRFEDRGGHENADWYAAYRRAEDTMAAGDDRASRLSSELLHRIDFVATARARRRNFADLRLRLRRSRAGAPLRFPPLADWVPQGYPVLVRDAAAMSRAMARRSVYCPMLWPDMPESRICARTRKLAGRVLLLPCDHRYGRADIERVAKAFIDVVGRGMFQEI